MNTIIDYLQQPSTWSGIFKLVASAGLFTFSTDQQSHITEAAIAIVGVIDVFRHEKTK